MDTVSETLAAEQEYFDSAWHHRERMRRNLRAAPAAAANAGAAARIRQDVDDRLSRIGRPDDAVAVGRMDDGNGEVLYVGHHTIFDDDSDVLVVNWQAPAAARYFTATHADAADRFQCVLGESPPVRAVVRAGRRPNARAPATWST